MTLKDVAQEAGVSVSTVSRIINKKGGNVASKQVQDHVWEIVRMRGYVPNTTARNLKIGESVAEEPTPRTLACLFTRYPCAITDPFFSQISRSFEQEAFKHNFLLKYSFSSMELQRHDALAALARDKTDGIAILGRCDKNLLKYLKKQFHYVIYIALIGVDANFDQIICDGLEASITAMEHLIGLGHTRIGYVGETQSEQRYRGYRETLQRHRIPINSAHVQNSLQTYEGGYRGTLRLLQSAPDITAIFFANDQTAVGALRAIEELGYKIPRDLSIISIDDVEMNQYLVPMLTTVHIPVDEMGQMAAKILIDRINGGHSLPVRVYLPSHLVVRDSCVCPRS